MNKKIEKRVDQFFEERPGINDEIPYIQRMIYERRLDAYLKSKGINCKEKFGCEVETLIYFFQRKTNSIISESSSKKDLEKQQAEYLIALKARLSNFNHFDGSLNDISVNDWFLPMKFMTNKYINRDFSLSYDLERFSLEVQGDEEILIRDFLFQDKGEKNIFFIDAEVGSGKTTFLKKALLDHLDLYRESRVGLCYLTSSDFRKNSSCLNAYFDKNKGIYSKIHFFIDGLDELEESTRNTVLDFISKNYKNKNYKFVICSRPLSYHENLNEDSLEVLGFEPLIGESKKKYLRVQLSKCLVDAEDIEGILSSFDTNHQLRSMTDKPALLQIVSLALKEIFISSDNCVEDARDCLREANIFDLYTRAIDYLLDKKEIGRLNHRFYKLNKNLGIFDELAFISHEYNPSSAEIPRSSLDQMDDEIVKLLYESNIVIKGEGDIDRFAHNSFKEYFLAQHFLSLDNSKSGEEKFSDGELEIFNIRSKNPDAFYADSFFQTLKFYVSARVQAGDLSLNNFILELMNFEEVSSILGVYDNQENRSLFYALHLRALQKQKLDFNYFKRRLHLAIYGESLEHELDLMYMNTSERKDIVKNAEELSAFYIDFDSQKFKVLEDFLTLQASDFKKAYKKLLALGSVVKLMRRGRYKEFSYLRDFADDDLLEYLLSLDFFLHRENPVIAFEIMLNTLEKNCNSKLDFTIKFFNNPQIIHFLRNDISDPMSIVDKLIKKVCREYKDNYRVIFESIIKSFKIDAPVFLEKLFSKLMSNNAILHSHDYDWIEKRFAALDTKLIPYYPNLVSSYPEDRLHKIFDSLTTINNSYRASRYYQDFLGTKFKEDTLNKIEDVVKSSTIRDQSIELSGNVDLAVLYIKNRGLKLLIKNLAIDLYNTNKRRLIMGIINNYLLLYNQLEDEDQVFVRKYFKAAIEIEIDNHIERSDQYGERINIHLIHAMKALISLHDDSWIDIQKEILDLFFYKISFDPRCFPELLVSIIYNRNLSKRYPEDIRELFYYIVDSKVLNIEEFFVNIMESVNKNIFKYSEEIAEHIFSYALENKDSFRHRLGYMYSDLRVPKLLGVCVDYKPDCKELSDILKRICSEEEQYSFYNYSKLEIERLKNMVDEYKNSANNINGASLLGFISNQIPRFRHQIEYHIDILEDIIGFAIDNADKDEILNMKHKVWLNSLVYCSDSFASHLINSENFPDYYKLILIFNQYFRGNHKYMNLIFPILESNYDILDYLFNPKHIENHDLMRILKFSYNGFEISVYDFLNEHQCFLTEKSFNKSWEKCIKDKKSTFEYYEKIIAMCDAILDDDPRSQMNLLRKINLNFTNLLERVRQFKNFLEEFKSTPEYLSACLNEKSNDELKSFLNENLEVHIIDRDQNTLAEDEEFGSHEDNINRALELVKEDFGYTAEQAPGTSQIGIAASDTKNYLMKNYNFYIKFEGRNYHVASCLMTLPNNARNEKELKNKPGNPNNENEVYVQYLAVQKALQGNKVGEYSLRGMFDHFLKNGIRYVRAHSPINKHNTILYLNKLNGRVVDYTEELHFPNGASLDYRPGGLRNDRYVILWDLYNLNPKQVSINKDSKKIDIESLFSNISWEDIGVDENEFLDLYYPADKYKGRNYQESDQVLNLKKYVKKYVDNFRSEDTLFVSSLHINQLKGKDVFQIVQDFVLRDLLKSHEPVLNVKDKWKVAYYLVKK